MNTYVRPFPSFCTHCSGFWYACLCFQRRPRHPDKPRSSPRPAQGHGDGCAQQCTGGVRRAHMPTHWKHRLIDAVRDVLTLFIFMLVTVEKILHENVLVSISLGSLEG